MIRLKETIDEKELEQYGFEKRLDRGWDSKRRCAYYRTVYCYRFYKIYESNFQSVEVYIEPFINAYGQVVYNAREVVARQHAFECDKAVNLIGKLLVAGIFEYVESEASKNG